MLGYIHSTESFGTVDGPGIRFVVFFQGCPMRCLYCHNPDTWGIGKGTEMSVEDILSQYEGVKEFLKGGGITATGGEPLVQLGFLTELFESAKKKGIHTCLDTSGVLFTPGDTVKFERLAECTDLVMLDIKHINSEKHKALTGHGTEKILAFAGFLSQRGVPIWIRHVVVPGVTDDEASLYELGRFISGLKTLKALDVLPYHTMAKEKYKKLGLEYPLGDTPASTKEAAAAARDVIMKGLRDGLKSKV